MSDIQKGTKICLCVTDLNNLGYGVGRMEADGRVVFVRGAVGGDEVEAEIIKVNRNFLVAKLIRVLKPSPHRIDNFCSAPNACGGCVYRYISYEKEAELKREYVENVFRKEGLSDVTVHSVLHTGKIEGYRNKAQYPIVQTKDGVRAGFFAAKTHKIMVSDTCAIQNPAFAPIVAWICSFATQKHWSVYQEETGKGLFRHIYLRIGEKTGQLMVCLVLNGSELPFGEEFCRGLREAFPSVCGILLNINRENTNVVLGKKTVALWGKPYLEDELCGLRFRISSDSFYQVNRDAAERLYGLAADLAELRSDETLLDLYCGTGSIGLSMAHRVRKVAGVEIVASAVQCARENAERNEIQNAEFFCADAGKREVILEAAGGTCPDVVVLDPPRKGSTYELVQTLAELNVPKIVYISCAPDTLARDCAWFREAGYTLGEVYPVDLFPRTGHVESVVCLTRK